LFQAVAENQPFKNRVKSNLNFSDFISRIRGVIAGAAAGEDFGPDQFADLAIELFRLQFASNGAYRAICEARGLTPETVKHWEDVPAVPTSAFKEMDVTCLPAEDRIAVFRPLA